MTYVTHREATKEYAVREWCNMYQLEQSEVIGFGDSGNDIPIFEAVGLRAATNSGTKVYLSWQITSLGPKENGLEHLINNKLLP